MDKKSNKRKMRAEKALAKIHGAIAIVKHLHSFSLKNQSHSKLLPNAESNQFAFGFLRANNAIVMGVLAWDLRRN